AVLRVGHIELPGRLPLHKAGIPNLVDDADDFAVDVFVTPGADPLAERIRRAEHALRKTPADNRHGRRDRLVGRRERATAEDRDAHGAEVVRAYDIPLGTDFRPGRRLRPALEQIHTTEAESSAADWYEGRQPCGFDAWRVRQAIDDRPEERLGLGGGGIPSRQGDASRQHPPRVEARIDVLHTPETTKEQ